MPDLMTCGFNFPASLRSKSLWPLALDEPYRLDAKAPGDAVFFNSNPEPMLFGKNVARMNRANSRKYRDWRNCRGRLSKFVKALRHAATVLYNAGPETMKCFWSDEMRRFFTVSCVLAILAPAVCSQKSVFENVKISRHRSAENRVLVDKLGSLTFDDTARRLVFKSGNRDTIDVGYGEVEKAVYEVTTHMRAGGTPRAISFVEVPFGAIVASPLAAVHVDSHWFYFHYRDGDSEASVLMEVPEATSDQLVSKASGVFGPRMTLTKFAEKAVDVKLRDLKDLSSKQVVNVDKKNHPLPETRPDKATVVVVCPTLAAHRAGSGGDFRVFANGEVIAVNKLGTYSFAYLDPAKHQLVSQRQNASGFETDLEAGQQYFFLQNTFQNGLSAAETVLSRNSPELVGYLLDGSYFSDWKPKAK
jgi:hypothetical protein